VIRAINLARYAATTPMELVQCSTKRLMSAEVEICGYEDSTRVLKEVLKLWNCSVVHDGSLPTGGFEINMHPASGDYWHAQCANIEEGLAEAKAFVDNQAGCHTHIDCRDCSYTDIAKVLLLYGPIEKYLFSMIPSNRRTNNHCIRYGDVYSNDLHQSFMHFSLPMFKAKPIQTTDEICKVAIIRALYGYAHPQLELNRLKRSKSFNGRYRAINMHSFIHRGTIEFRFPPGTVRSINIRNWGILLAHLVDTARALPLSTIILSMRGRTDTEKETQVLELLKVGMDTQLQAWMKERQTWALSATGKES
jgi:hypothetical protein